MRFCARIFCLSACVVAATAQGQGGQLDFTNILNGALRLVQPLFERRQQSGGRGALQSDVPSGGAGLVNGLSLDKIGLCKENKGICDFILCNAQNFQRDESFANLKLATQVLADSEMRDAVVQNPQIMSAVCSQANMVGGQCDLFQNGFKMIDRMMGFLEQREQRRLDAAGHTMSRRRSRRLKRQGFSDLYGGDSGDDDDAKPARSGGSFSSLYGGGDIDADAAQAGIAFDDYYAIYDDPPEDKKQDCAKILLG